MWQEDKKLMGFKDLESWISYTPKAILVLEAVGIHYISQKEAAKMYAFSLPKTPHLAES